MLHSDCEFGALLLLLQKIFTERRKISGKHETRWDGFFFTSLKSSSIDSSQRLRVNKKPRREILKISWHGHLMTVSRGSWNILKMSLWGSREKMNWWENDLMRFQCAQAEKFFICHNWRTNPVPIKSSRREKWRKLINEDSERKPTPISIFSRRGSHFSAHFYRRLSKKMKSVFLSLLVHSRPCLVVIFWSWKLVSISSSRLANNFLRVKFLFVTRAPGAICAAFLNRAHSNGQLLRRNRFHILSWVTRSQSQMFWGRKLITGRLTRNKKFVNEKNWSILSSSAL